MIGLVNAVGAYQASRVQSSDSPRTGSSTARDVGEPPMWVRPYKPRGAEPETTHAVEATEFREGQAERKAPSGDESEQFKQAELESRASGNVGAFLDTIA